MTPPLYGLVASGEGKWTELSGHGHLRARIYSFVDSFVALTVTEAGYYQVVEQRNGDRRPMVVLRRSIPAAASTQFTLWPAEQLRREAGLVAADG
jgi:hypothetical protein